MSNEWFNEVLGLKFKTFFSFFLFDLLFIHVVFEKSENMFFGLLCVLAYRQRIHATQEKK